MFYNLKIVFHVKLYIFYSCSKISKIFLVILNNDPEKKIIEQNFGLQHNCFT